MKAPSLMVVACAVAACTYGCSGRSVEDRAREAEKMVKDSMGPDLEAVAMTQPIDPNVAKEVQENLAVLHEYQGEINGTFDVPSVNAIQAFQRTAGLKDDGIVDERTRTKLQAAAAAAKRGAGAAGG
jgi:murein L,D-transpeptidase YcbB/YkuD